MYIPINLKRKSHERRNNLYPRLASGRNKGNRKMKRKYVFIFVVLFAGIFIGNQIFNHVHAWTGITVIVASVVYFFNRLIKYLKDENIV